MHRVSKDIKIFIPKPSQTAAMPFFISGKICKKNPVPLAAIYPKGGMDARLACR
jgi:hypothetical protein